MQLFNDRRKWGRRLLAAGSACFFLGTVAYWYTDGFDFPSVPPPLPPAKAAPPVASRATAQTAAVQAESPKQGANGTEPSVQTDAGTAGTLHNFAAKQAQLDEAKLDVAIAEQQAKLKELREGKPAPVVSHTAPQPVPVSLPPLPPLVQPVPAPSGGEPSIADALPPVRRTSGLVAIQGMDGNLSAVFATGNGKKTVRVGDSIMGSKVRAINLDGVTLASGKTVTIGD